MPDDEGGDDESCFHDFDEECTNNPCLDVAHLLFGHWDCKVCGKTFTNAPMQRENMVQRGDGTSELAPKATEA